MMVNLRIFTLTLLLGLINIPIQLKGQDCMAPVIELKTQADVDNFSTNYPGCTVIEGYLSIGNFDPPSDVTNLDGLSQITEVHGYLIIINNPVLTSIQGLQNLNTIGQELWIQDNPLLSTLEGLEQITVIPENLRILNNCPCLQLTGLENLRTIGSNLWIQDGNFNGLSPLAQLDSVYGEIAIRGETELQDLTGLNNLSFLGRGLRLEDTKLTSLAGLNNMIEIGGIDFTNNVHLVDFSAISSIEKVNGNVAFHNSGSPAVMTSLKRIEGGLSYRNNLTNIDLVGNANLEYIGGELSVSLTTTGSITGFEKLDTVKGTISLFKVDGLSTLSAYSNIRYLGSYEIQQCESLPVIPDLNELTYLGGLKIVHNSLLTSVPAFPLLHTINGDVSIIDNRDLLHITGYNNMERINGSLLIKANSFEIRSSSGEGPETIDAFHNLTYVGGNLDLPYFEDLQSVRGFELVDTIGGYLELKFVSTTTHTFPVPHQFKYIGDRITLRFLSQLVDMTSFSNLNTIHGDLTLFYCNNLETMSGLDNVTLIDGSMWMTGCNLKSMEGMANLQFIGGWFDVHSCDSLITFAGLEELDSISGRLGISSNQNLQSLTGLEGIDPASLESGGTFTPDIVITNNPNLSYCHLPNLCEAIYIHHKSFKIEDNDEGCDAIQEWECNEYGLSGKVFYDANQNQIEDEDEYGIPHLGILVEPDQALSLTHTNGKYIFFAEEDSTYMLSLQNAPDWIITTPAVEYTRTFELGSPTNHSNDFGIFPTVDHMDLDVNLSSQQTRCNKSVLFNMRFRRDGIGVVDGRMDLKYDSDVTYLSSSIPPAAHDTNLDILSWNVDSLLPFLYEDIEINFRIPNEMHDGEQLNFTAIANLDSMGTIIPKDTFQYDPTVVCSYDPNDKIAIPVGIEDEHYTLKGEKITYTIRFENKGSAEAIDITVIDTLDPALDVSTFRIVNSSALVYPTLRGQVVTFSFPAIWLPSMGQGFVTYEIQAFPDVEDVTEIENHADIIFDSNSPITTNTTLNTLVESFCSNISVEIDTTICEGESFSGHTIPGDYIHIDPYGSYCDSTTIIHLNVEDLIINEINFEVCQGDIIDIHGHQHIADSSITIIDTMYSVTGCITEILSAHIEVYIPESISIDTFICEGESYLGYDEEGVYSFDSLNVTNGCFDHVELNLEVIPLGTGECIVGTIELDNEKLKVYPNPASTEIVIESEIEVASISLLGADGKLWDIFSEKQSQKHIVLQLDQQIPGGVYVLEFKGLGYRIFRRIVVTGME